MIYLPKQICLRISEGLVVRNHLNAEIQVTQQYAEVRISLAKVKPPVIITLSQGRGENGTGKAKTSAPDERVV